MHHAYTKAMQLVKKLRIQFKILKISEINFWNDSMRCSVNLFPSEMVNTVYNHKQRNKPK